MRNSSLQGAYLMLAARALGLDAGPMSGFDADKVGATFFLDCKVSVGCLLSSLESQIPRQSSVGVELRLGPGFKVDRGLVPFLR